MTLSRWTLLAEPGLPAYQEWSDELRTFASSVRRADLAQHLNRVADLSVHAVSVVRDLRHNPDASADVIHAHQGARRRYRRMPPRLLNQPGGLHDSADPVWRT